MEQPANPSTPARIRPGLVIGITMLLGVLVMVGVVVIVRLMRGEATPTTVAPTASSAAIHRRDGLGVDGEPASAVNRTGSAAALRTGATLPRAVPATSLVRLFDTDALCEHYGTVGCERGRSLATGCERGEIADCRSLLAMFSNGPFADLALANAVAELLCRRGNECERRDQLVRFAKASLNFADHVDARAACKRGDALACATAGLAYGDNLALRLEWAERACALGVATRGGCIEITLLAPTLKAKVAAVQRACDAGSPPACSLVAAMLTADRPVASTDQQKVQAARALQRCCTLAPGAKCCNTLTPAEQPD